MQQWTCPVTSNWWAAQQHAAVAHMRSAALRAQHAAAAHVQRSAAGAWIAVTSHSKPILCDYCEFFNFARAFHNDFTILSQNNSKFSNVVRLLWVVSQGVFTENSQIPHNHTVNFLRLWNVCEMFRNDFFDIISHQFEVYCFFYEFFVKCFASTFFQHCLTIITCQKMVNFLVR